MDINPFSGVAVFFDGLIHEGHLQAWLRLIASLAISAIVTMLSTFGVVLTANMLAGQSPIVALFYAMGASSTMTAGVLVVLWKGNPAAKDIPIAFPSGAPNKALEGGVTVDPNKQK